MPQLRRQQQRRVRQQAEPDRDHHRHELRTKPWDDDEVQGERHQGGDNDDEPVAEWSKAYADLYQRYRELYAALKPTYDALGSDRS